MTTLGGKTVLVTGAARGLGRLMALEAAQRGATLALWDVDRPLLDVVAKEVVAAGGRAVAHTCDVGDRDAVHEAAGLLRRDVGPVDVLVNNAGVVSGRPLLDLTAEDVERTFRVNALSHFWTTQEFLPSMVEHDSGHIVSISSAAGLTGTARLSDYAASKHAVVGFTESLRCELATTAPGVRTTLVCPSYVDTGMFEGAEVRSRRLLPMLRQEDVAAAVIRAVEQDRERLFLPSAVYLLPPLLGLPPRLSDAVLKALGVTESMDRFVGREEPR